jgi:hypothetical protein
LQPRGKAVAVDLVEDVLGPVLSAPPSLVEACAAHLFASVGGVWLPSLWSVDSLAAQLLRPPARWERPQPAFDDIGELVELDDANMPRHLAESLRKVLSPAACAPQRLSALLEEAGVTGGTRLADLVLLGSLWVWFADKQADEQSQPPDEGIASLLAGLVTPEPVVVAKASSLTGEAAPPHAPATATSSRGCGG